MDRGVLRGDREIFESLFTVGNAIEHHMATPLFAERAKYLRHLAERGMQRKTIRDTAALLLHAIRLLTPKENSETSEAEIRHASMLWSREALAHRPVGRSSTSAQRFYTAANGFLQFNNMKAKTKPFSCIFDPLYLQFYDSLCARGYLPTTIAALAPPVGWFLLWLSKRQTDMSLVCWQDIETYLDAGIRSGWRSRTVLGRCQALRNFFKFAESRGYCKVGLHRSIVNPVVRSRDNAVSGPSWEDVRRMIRVTGSSSAQESRAKAILLLCCVYGLRSTEVRELTSQAFDWASRCFTVKRAKNGYWQRFPITEELDEALISYIGIHRPASECRNLFVTLRPPYRPLLNLCPIIKKRMQAVGLETASFGAHSLRHSCATELLRQGTSLQNIANLLGHRDLRSVSVYARHDMNSLRDVADFSLSGIT
jgi:integrase/recombinase XerD